MKPYEHILVATDFSALAEVALRRALGLAGSARLTILHVVEHFPEDIPAEQISPEDVDPTQFIRNQAQQRLNATAETVHAEMAVLKVVMSTGSARAAIAEEAGREKVDLIVVGANGGGTMSGLLGSTATGVSQSAACDVLVVRG